MAILDAQGRLFGKVSVLDIGAALVILLVFFGIFVYPGGSGSIAQGNSTTKPVEIEVVTRVARDVWRELLKPGDKTKLIIRNQPYGEITIKTAEEVPENVVAPQPDGQVKSLPDPRIESSLSRNILITLTGDAQITQDGPVLGNSKIKVGTPIEIEGFRYNFSNLNVRDVRILEPAKK